jgi:hypothetical protein
MKISLRKMEAKEANSRYKATINIYEQRPTLTQSDKDNKMLCEFFKETKGTYFLCKC